MGLIVVGCGGYCQKSTVGLKGRKKNWRPELVGMAEARKRVEGKAEVRTKLGRVCVNQLHAMCTQLYGVKSG